MGSEMCIRDRFLECVVAPGFTPEAREVLAAKANLRLLELAPQAIDLAGPDHVRSILGGLLVQDLDDQAITPADWTVASQRPPHRRKSRTWNLPGAWCATFAPTPSLWPRMARASAWVLAG